MTPGFLRAKKVIKSCKTMSHLNVARNYGALALKQIVNTNVPFDTFTKHKQELQKLTTEKFEEVKLPVEKLRLPSCPVAILLTDPELKERSD